MLVSEGAFRQPSLQLARMMTLSPKPKATRTPMERLRSRARMALVALREAGRRVVAPARPAMTLTTQATSPLLEQKISSLLPQ